MVTFLTPILCVSSWIMGEGQIENIYWLLMNFPVNFLTSCTSIEQVNLPPSHIRKILYQHQDSDIPNTHIMCLLLNHGWPIDKKIYWLLMNFSDNLLTSCTSIEQGNLPSSHIGNTYYINTRIVTFLTHTFDKLLPLPEPPVRARTDARTNPSAQRATQLRRVLALVYAVSIQNQITTTVP
jgi:hypothetical protein